MTLSYQKDNDSFVNRFYESIHKGSIELEELAVQRLAHDKESVNRDQ